MRFFIGFLCLWLAGCASGSSGAVNKRDYGFRDGVVWVRGPWGTVQPSRDIDEVIDRLCPAVMELPGATFKDYGQEYCGVIYSLADGLYYASIPSPLGPTVLAFVAKRKQCKPPQIVFDGRGHPVIEADFHSHPWWPSEMSRQDRQARTQLYSIRIQFDTECRIMKLIPYKYESRPGEVYVRQGKSWKLIGLIKIEDKTDGIMTAIGE